jgi:hypothetical protein
MNQEWYKDFPWGKWEPVSWWNNVTLLAMASRAGWTQTLEVGVGQYCNGLYLFGMRAKRLGCRHAAIDISPTNLGRAKQVIARHELPVDLLEFDSKAVAWGRRMQLIYIDGGHSYAQVMGDIANFCRWVVRSGLMVFDDYGKRHLEVTQAVDDAIKGYESAFEMSIFPAQEWAVWRRR